MSPARSRSLRQRISAAAAPAVPALERPRARPRLGRGDVDIVLARKKVKHLNQCDGFHSTWRARRRTLGPDTVCVGAAPMNPAVLWVFFRLLRWAFWLAAIAYFAQFAMFPMDHLNSFGH